MAPKQTEIPGWLLEALEGECTDDLLNKRSEARHVGGMLVSATLRDEEAEKPFSVRIMNASTKGVGFISRQRLEPGAKVKLTTDWVPEDGTPCVPVNVRVVHCTQTIQGYKVGTVLE